MPIIMMGYMGMMLVALDIMIFSGQYSIWHQIAGPSAGQSANAFDPTNNINKDNFKSVFYVDYGSVFKGSSSTANAGTLGTVKDMGKKGSDFETSVKGNPLVPAVGFQETALNLSAMAASTGKTPGAYIADILLAFCAAAQLAYVMYSLLSYIPELASGLVGQDTMGSMAAVSKSAVFAEAEIRNVANIAKEALLAYASGGTSAAASGGRMAAQQAAKQAAQKAATELASRRDK